MPLIHNELQEAIGGLARGVITELTGEASSGRATLEHALLASATALGEVCAVIDTANSFDPETAELAGVELNRLLWVQCAGRLDQALKATDMLLHGGGFGAVVLDLCQVPDVELNRVPISYWHRFRLAVKNSTTAFVVAARHAQARACAARQITLEPRRAEWVGRTLLAGLWVGVALRKPVRGETVELRARAIGE